MAFTHAVTIDTDGQLDPAQIPDLLRVAGRSPGALVLGARDAEAPDYPAASRLGRWASNVLVRWESGAHVTDSQCGYRVYPLGRIRALRCRAARYGFETEILTRAAWAGMAIREVRVDCAYKMPEGRVSHFRQWRDSWACAGMHIRLLARSLAPWPSRHIGGERDHSAETGMIWHRLARWLSPARAWRAVRQDPAEGSRCAAALATGVFIANLPLYGVQTLLSLFAARKLRLNPLPVILGSHLSTPPLGALLIGAAIAIGHLLTHGTFPRLASFDPSVVGYRALIGSVLLEWTIGGIVCGAVLSAVTFAVTWLLLRWLPLRTPEAGATHPGGSAPIPDCEVAESVA